MEHGRTVERRREVTRHTRDRSRDLVAYLRTPRQNIYSGSICFLESKLIERCDLRRFISLKQIFDDWL